MEISREQLIDDMIKEISRANGEIAELRADLARINILYDTTSTAGKNVSKALDEALHTITVLRADLAAARANAIDLSRLSQSEVFDLVQAALAHLSPDDLWKVRKLVTGAEETKAGKW